MGRCYGCERICLLGKSVLMYRRHHISRYQNPKPTIPFGSSPPSILATLLRKSTTKNVDQNFTRQHFGYAEDEEGLFDSIGGILSVRGVVALLRNLVPRFLIGSSPIHSAPNPHLVDRSLSTRLTRWRKKRRAMTG